VKIGGIEMSILRLSLTDTLSKGIEKRKISLTISNRLRKAG
jgi:hypothetical protein